MGINNVVLVGRLTQDPELRYTNNGTAKCHIKIAVDRNYQPSNGEKQTDFIPAVVWGAQGEAVAAHKYKGDLVGVTGEIHFDSWQDKDDNWHNYTYVNADAVQFLDNRGKEKAEAEAEEEKKAAEAKKDEKPVRNSAPARNSRR